MFCKVIFNFIFNREFRRCFLSNCRALRYSVFKNDYPKAIEEYKSMLENGVSGMPVAKVYQNLAEVYHWNGNYDKAETALRKALELKMKTKEHDPVLYKLLGNVCVKKGQYEEALMFYDKAVQFGKKGFVNKMLVDMDYVLKQKALLEEYKPILPFMTAYFQQNKEKFRYMRDAPEQTAAQDDSAE